ncbi:MAG: pyruvate, phosphate dikinase, partial [Desulfobacterales bacterium]
MKVKSKALEVNLADYHVDVTIDDKYSTLQQVMSRYYGLMEGLNTFLEELSHPYKNWRFIVTEARKYSLDHFHLLKNHSRGPVAAQLLVDILISAVESSHDPGLRSDAVDNLLLFIGKIIKDSGPSRATFVPVIQTAFQRIHDFPDDLFDLFVKSYYQIKRVAEACYREAPEVNPALQTLNRLLIKYFQRAYDYWLGERDPQKWFEKEASEFTPQNNFDAFFKDISHQQLREFNRRLDQVAGANNCEAKATLADLLELPGFHQIVEHYRQIPRELLQHFGENSRGQHLKLIFLFHIMNTSGLALIHEETLRDINQTLTWIIVHENYRNIQNLIRKTFSILKERADMYPAATLNCVLNMGKGVFKTDEIDLVNFFIDSVIDLGFQTPMLQGVDDGWQIKVNSAHILNIRTWLELIE